MRRRAARILPWVIGLGILAALFRRIDLAAVGGSLAQGPYLALGIFLLLLNLLVLVADAVATRSAFRVCAVELPLAELILLRGATYLAGLVSYAIGQSAVGLYLYRRGIPALRSTGVMLFTLATNALALATLALASAWALLATELRPAATGFILFTVLAIAGYALVLLLRPAGLAARAALAPQFAAGLRGHLLALAARLPHILLLAVGQWAALRLWGLPISLRDGMVRMPLVLFVTALPIAPSGLGTTQAAQVALFAPLLPVSGGDRAAAVLACGLAQQALGTLAQAAVGLACWLWLRRRQRQPTEPLP